MIKKLSDVVCGLNRAQVDEEREFLGLPSKPTVGGFPDLGLKISSCGLVIWLDDFLVWASKSSGLYFIGCVTKLIGG
jgi:hypothetical protein